MTYVDVDGPASMFARWFFATKGYEDIEVMLADPKGLVLPPGRSWDFIFSDAVVEHLVDPAGTLESLARAIRPGGMLYLIIDAHTVNAHFPMHRHVDIGELLADCPTPRAMTRVKQDGDGLNVFRRPRSTTVGDLPAG